MWSTMKWIHIHTQPIMADSVEFVMIRCCWPSVGDDLISVTDDMFKCIFLNENVWISKISLKFFPNGPNINIPALMEHGDR